jgi:hypothetical protein
MSRRNKKKESLLEDRTRKAGAHSYFQRAHGTFNTRPMKQKLAEYLARPFSFVAVAHYICLSFSM